ncbi:phage tail tape measure protein [Acetobacter fallax]|uniref:Phage tail tape measure protein n=1 Tax=Acetobacter fallax TaxID=1737473 RepID=A0ABX0KHE0_9PROT|nr:phage tail tape measure protein [Acetobacter fallax]NHO33332.1 phage tail tape measure protein [Acetobacter fallax]NHO36953.1 phage tail tape measure protein [Acetobacter fallax]
MADDLRAKFQLDFNVGSTEAISRVEQILQRIDGALDKLRRAVDPFAEMTAPVARATAATQALNETLARTTQATGSASEATTVLNEALNVTGSAAAEAGEGLSVVGTQAESAAARVSDAAARMQSAMRGVSAMNDFHAGYGGSAGSAGGGMGRVRAAGGAISGFGDSINAGIGNAFGAAATGLGLIAPIHAAAEYDNDLTHIGITLGQTGAANAPFARALGERIDAIARQTGQKSPDLVGAASFLSQEGYSLPKIESFLPQVARISTAYNSAPSAVAKTAFALNQNLGISDAQLPTALAMIARVGKESALPMEQLAPLFPLVASAAGEIGVSGPQGVADLASMMAIIRKNVGTEGEATTDLRRVISTFTSNHGRTRFKKLLGVDPQTIMDQANDQGRDPLAAVMDRIQAVPTARGRQHAVAELFANLEDRTAAAAMTRQFDQMMAIRDRIQNTSPQMINADFDTGLQSTLIRLQAFEDALGQLNRRIGSSFVPVLNTLTFGLKGLVSGFDAVNEITSGWASTISGGVGGFLAFATALGVIRAVCGPLLAGLSLLRIGALALISPWGLVGMALAGVGVAAYEIYKHWDGIKPYFTALGSWMTSWGRSIGSFFSHIFDGFSAAFHDIENRIASSSLGHLMGMSAVPHLVPAIPSGGGQSQFGLHVSHEPGLRITQTGGPRGAMTIGPDRGRMVAQP